MEEPSVILQGPAVVSVCWMHACFLPSPTSSPALLVHHHFLHPHQGLWEKGGETVLWPQRRGRKRNRDEGEGGKAPGSPSVPTAPASVLLMGEGCRGREGRGGGDGHLTVALQPLTWLPRPQTLTPSPGWGQHMAQSTPQLVHSQLHAHSWGFSEPPSWSSVSQSLQADEADAC